MPLRPGIRRSSRMRSNESRPTRSSAARPLEQERAVRPSDSRASSKSPRMDSSSSTTRTFWISEAVADRFTSAEIIARGVPNPTIGSWTMEMPNSWGMELPCDLRRVPELRARGGENCNIRGPKIAICYPTAGCFEGAEGGRLSAFAAVAGDGGTRRPMSASGMVCAKGEGVVAPAISARRSDLKYYGKRKQQRECEGGHRFVERGTPFTEGGCRDPSR